MICYNDLVKRMYFAVITRKGVIITRDEMCEKIIMECVKNLYFLTFILEILIIK